MKKVFLSYAHEDKASARRIADALRTSGMSVTFDEWELGLGDSIQSRVSEQLSTSDFLLVLLSKQAVASRWIHSELDAFLGVELRDRAITLVPVLLEDCPIPTKLADRTYLDMRGDFNAGLGRLVQQLGGISNVQFSRLTSQIFEQLVHDLLSDVGFTVQKPSSIGDSGFDFVATFASRDPFGAPKRDTWLVEAKFYQKERVSISALRQMIGSLSTHPTAKNALVVTNGQLTSAARDFLESARPSVKGQLRVVDGEELMNLLLRRPELARRYFATDVPS